MLKLDGGADANLRLSGSFAGTNDDFPAIDADFHLHWSFSSSNPAPQVTIDNVSLDLGQFLSNVLKPVLQTIQTTSKPLEPVQEILRTALPGLSDLRHLVDGKDVTLLDLADIYAQNYTQFGPLWDLIHSMGDLIHSIDQLDLNSTLKVPLGGFDVQSNDLREVGPAGDVHDLTLSNLTTLAASGIQAANLPVPSQATQFLQNVAASLTNGYEIKFPILDDPKQAVFNLLLGRDSDLFTFTADYVINSEGTSLPSFSVFGCGIEFSGDVHLDAHFKFAYDTFGLRELIDHLGAGDTSHIASDINDGFYIADDSHFILSGGLFAGVSATYGIFSAEVGGFVSTDDHGDEPVSITFDDPNHDGKLRFSEFEAGLHTSGKFTAELGIEVRIGVHVLGHFIGVKKHFDIATKVLVDLNMPGPDDPPLITGPILASQPDAQGSIDLYIGAEAGMRQQVDQNDGNEQIIIKHVDSPPGAPPDGGETVEIGILQHTAFLGTPYWVTQTISGVKSISGYGDLGDLNINVLPQVTSNVDLEGGDGMATLTYSGSGAALLKAGQEDSELVGGSGNNNFIGGPGNDTIALGSAGNFVGAGAGDNTIIITTPMTQDGLIVGGTDEGNNTIVVLAGDGTQSISVTPGSNPNFIELNYQNAGSPPAPAIVLGQFTTLVISAQDRSTAITVGDVSGAGVTQVFVNEPTVAATGRTVDLDARAGLGSSQLSLEAFEHVYPDPSNPLQFITDHALKLVNSTTGQTTYLMGTAGDDVTTTHQHGGTLAIGQLIQDDGLMVFDAASRQPGQGEFITMTTPAELLGNLISSHPYGAGDFGIDAVDIPTLVFHGLATIDTTIMNVAAPILTAGANQVSLDASTLAGALDINFQGNASAANRATVSKVGTQASLIVDGNSTSTQAFLGTGRLADIKHNLAIYNAVLTIDDSATLTPDISTLSASAFQWTIPALGFAPTLSVSGLHGALTVIAGADDRFDVEQTPPGITQVVFNNSFANTQDTIYAVGASSPMIANGNFSVDLGWRLNLDGTVTQLDQLSGLATSITLNFSGGPTGDVVLDGDLDPAGARYFIDGGGSWHVINQTVGLDVAINGFRDQDQIQIHLPGGSVYANLMQTGPGIITVDGSARTSGINPSAVNDITVDSRGGNMTLDPAGNDISVLHLFDTLYLASSLPQDNLTLNVPTQTNVTNNVTIDASQLEGALHVNAADPLAAGFQPIRNDDRCFGGR